MEKLSKKNPIKELAQELDVFDEMLSTLVELLQEKGIISQKEFEDKMKAHIERAKTKRSYRDIEFDKCER